MTTKWEEFSVSGEQIVGKIKEIIHEGNVRSVTIKTQEGKVIASFPLTVGVIGAALAPILAAVGAITALVTEYTIVIERDADPDAEDEERDSDNLQDPDES